MIIERAVPASGSIFEKPAVYFSPIAQPISNRPAKKRNNQAISGGPFLFQGFARMPAMTHRGSSAHQGRGHGIEGSDGTDGIHLLFSWFGVFSCESKKING